MNVVLCALGALLLLIAFGASGSIALASQATSATPKPGERNVTKGTDRSTAPEPLPAGTHMLDFVKAGSPGTLPPYATPRALVMQTQAVSETATATLKQSRWVVFTVQPGSYAAPCFFPDEQTRMAHTMEGMVTIFTVQ